MYFILVWYRAIFSSDKRCRRENIADIIKKMYEQTEGHCDGLIIIGKCNKEALERVLEEAEDFAKNGVSPVGCVWTIAPGSVFFRQKTPSLEYYVRLSKGFDELRRKYNISIDMDNYRRCGNHPDTDLSRI